MSLPRIQAALEKLDAQMTETQSQVKRVEDLIRNTRAEANSKSDKMLEDQGAKFTNLKTELSAMRTDLNSMKSGISIRIDSIDKRINTLEISFKKLEETLRQA
jgi:peptidoglycan hydrolase CwlO-like protein